MSKNKLLSKLIQSGEMVLYHDYRRGSFSDLSIYGNDGTPDALWFCSQGVVAHQESAKIVVSNSTELQATTEGTCVCLSTIGFSKATDPGTEYIMRKDDQFYFGRTATSLRFYDWTSTRTLSGLPVDGNKYLAVNFSDGAIPEAFVDGVTAGSFNGTTTVPGSTEDLSLLNDPGNDNFDAVVSALLLINRVLSATEHAELYAELLDVKWPK